MLQFKTIAGISSLQVMLANPCPDLTSFKKIFIYSDYERLPDTVEFSWYFATGLQIFWFPKDPSTLVVFVINWKSACMKLYQTIS